MLCINFYVFNIVQISIHSLVHTKAPQHFSIILQIDTGLSTYYYVTDYATLSVYFALLFLQPLCDQRLKPHLLDFFCHPVAHTNIMPRNYYGDNDHTCVVYVNSIHETEASKMLYKAV